MVIDVTPRSPHWVRSSDGWIAGVCDGLGESFDINPNWLRLGWIIALFCFGTGLLIYIMLAIALPTREKFDSSHEGRIWGVCSRISDRTNLEVGLVRFLALFLLFVSFGAAVIGYVILHFVLEDHPNRPRVYRQ